MELTDKTWNGLVDKITSAYRLTREESEKLAKNNVAKLIAAIPFNAECENMERTALTHLSTYILAGNPACKSDFSHNEFDNEGILKRIQPLNTFQGGMKKIIERGLNLLALVQLEDHQHDIEMDMQANKYNPILDGIWNYVNQKRQLLVAINNVPCPEMDKVLSPIGVLGFWQPF